MLINLIYSTGFIIIITLGTIQFACVSVPSQDTHFGRLKKVLDKEHIANFGLWWHTYCFFLLSFSMLFSSSVFQFVGVFGEPVYCRTDLHYTGGLHCIALHWHTSVCTSVCPPKKYFYPPPSLKKINRPPPWQRFLGPQKRVFFWYWCFYPHQLRESVSPVCYIFLVYVLIGLLINILKI